MTLNQDVDWNEIDSLVKILSKTISKLPRTFSSITTLSRGGLVPSRLLADHLGIGKILVDKNKISSDSLFIDDIFDTGDTFNKTVSKVDDPSKLVFVTLFARRGKKYPKQLIYAKKTDNSAYVVFPWDRLEFKRSQN
ncbi:phosphoribosyltransferase [Nitrosopumilus ureiphilus]|uniref:Phosphoribosyltransferase n=1 Tax=Nitrosopumilus ureiphilus TaxID=1470067 RepID=A0A7D5RDV0_9ARCH|nr:phosphoribosyltransferase [Nitrosopumilus ureiphilus]QLH06981.1 phosphoribosyltransferase [Nitrosopumilus ureiphilus]